MEDTGGERTRHDRAQPHLDAGAQKAIVGMLQRDAHETVMAAKLPGEVGGSAAQPEHQPDRKPVDRKGWRGSGGTCSGWCLRLRLASAAKRRSAWRYRCGPASLPPAWRFRKCAAGPCAKRRQQPQHIRRLRAEAPGNRPPHRRARPASERSMRRPLRTPSRSRLEILQQRPRARQYPAGSTLRWRQGARPAVQRARQTAGRPACASPASHNLRVRRRGDTDTGGHLPHAPARPWSAVGQASF